MTHFEEKSVGFIGTGVMGNHMARHLMEKGHPLHIYTRTKQKAENLIEAGAIWHDDVASISQHVDILITMVGYPKDVEEVYFGELGILHHAPAGQTIIDMTTSKPGLAEQIYKAGKAKQLHILDAPVSGGDIGAKNQTLAIMVGGEEQVFQQMKPLFETLGKNITLHGKAGAGQHTKMCNQITNALNMIGVCEAIIYAKKAGLDPVQMVQTVSSGAATSWALENLGPRMLKGDYAPGFYVKHFIKDMLIALESAEELGLELSGSKLALSLYEQLSEMGEDDSGTQALIKYFLQQ